MATGNAGNADLPTDDTLDQLVDTNRHILSPEGVSAAMRREFVDIIRPIKLNLCPTEDVTDTDITRFLARVFQQWTTRRPHSKPGKIWAQASFEDTAVEIGTLTRYLPTSATTKADRANVYDREPPGSQTNNSRKRGAPIFIRAVMNDGLDSVNFQFLDENSKMVSGKQGIYFSELDKADIYFLAMERHDAYYAGRVHEYNQAIGVFLARNRLQFWRQGNPVYTRPEEPQNLIIQFDLCRNLGKHREQALAKLRALPAPSYQ
ncbi:hypothetical protein McanMca71_007738 [Microsporum canis]|uniref:Uncharacterized protein n=1 Tax=Arthroderma otae (strain ATCC MYA-4605 / CBS 113480) TaxID=554155 RepID=C5FZ29_ARTOC|nr:uncharacterized protein MCYG_07951 [Microsporum canis CBS 113480]EEQ35132.1 predicted protein [Microsporum canis CBS 113480]